MILISNPVQKKPIRLIDEALTLVKNETVLFLLRNSNPYFLLLQLHVVFYWEKNCLTQVSKTLGIWRKCNWDLFPVFGSYLCYHLLLLSGKYCTFFPLQLSDSYYYFYSSTVLKGALHQWVAVYSYILYCIRSAVALEELCGQGRTTGLHRPFTCHLKYFHFPIMAY